MTVPRAVALFALLLLAGCISPGANVEPGDRLGDHTACDFTDRDGKAIDCSQHAHVLEVVPRLPDAIWLCTEFKKTGGPDSTDPNLFGIFYDPQGKRNAFWFNLTWEGRLEPPGVWEAVFFMGGGHFYSFRSTTPTGYVVLPKTLPDGDLNMAFIRMNVTLGGALAEGSHRVLWTLEPEGPDSGSVEQKGFGALHVVEANGTDYLFYGWGDKLLQGEDYSFKVWWSTHGMGVGGVRPTSLPPDGAIGFAWTPYGDFSACTR